MREEIEALDQARINLENALKLVQHVRGRLIGHQMVEQWEGDKS